MKLWLAGIRLALDTIREHKLRAFLTVLGVIIGTGTIIAVGSILAGLNGAITSVINNLGANTAIVFKFPVGVRFTRLTSEERQRKPLTYENAVAIAERCPAVDHVSPYLFPPNAMGPRTDSARYKGNDAYSLQLGGTEESYAEGGQADMKMGRFFTDTENRHHMPVVVIGEDVYKGLFALEDPIGKAIQVDGHQLTVIGVMNRPAASFPGQDDKRVLLPYFTMKKLFPQAQENMLVVVAKPGYLPEAIDETRTVLRQERRVPFSKPDNFAISTADQMIDQFHQITAMTALVMVVLSSIGLLVGGIG
ncbi:MAG: ABC transporter permease, partial [Bryobacteraceae bacterium]